MEFLSFRRAGRAVVLAEKLGLFFSLLLAGAVLHLSSSSALADDQHLGETIEKLSYCKVLLRGDQVDRDILEELAELKTLIYQSPIDNPERSKRMADFIAGISYLPVAKQALEGVQQGAGKSGHLYTLAPVKSSMNGVPVRAWYGFMIVMSDRILKFIFDTEQDDYRFYYTKLEEVGDGSYFSTVIDSHSPLLKGRIFKNGFTYLSGGIIQMDKFSLGFPEFWEPAEMRLGE